MITLRKFAIHHTGGYRSDPYASTLHVTPEEISAEHKRRWRGYNPSQYISREDLRYGGYTVCYDPKTRLFTQFRAYGEETMAQYRHNFDTPALVIVGNYTIDPKTGESADPMTKQIEDDVSEYIGKILDGDHRHILVAPDVFFDISISRVLPHRHFQRTECYGTSLSDSWMQNLLKDRKYPESKTELNRKVMILKRIVELYLQAIRLKNRLGSAILPPPLFGGPGEHACTGVFTNYK